MLTINIHKALYRLTDASFAELATRTVSADIVCLQEVMGAHEVHPLHVENWPDTSHYEFLADTMWSDFAYGRNAVYPEGHHGNAVLSRYPIEHYENRDSWSWSRRKSAACSTAALCRQMTLKSDPRNVRTFGLPAEAHRQMQLYDACRMG